MSPFLSLFKPIRASYILPALAITLGAEAIEIDVQGGRLAGITENGTHRFYGVPYAQPPVGDLRWKAPQMAAAWDGVRDASSPASACTQTGNFFTSDDESRFNRLYGAEDCLYLNVWMPDNASDKRPALIFFHGGSGVFGQSSHAYYDGANLARATDTVVITANYRLGIWGSIHTRALKTGNPENDSGNFFLLDMIQAVDWIRENCAAFSCDRDNITISGHSAGAVYVLALMRSPIADGKFQKTISFSGAPFTATLEEGKARTRKFITQLLIDDGAASNSSESNALIDNMTDAELETYLRGKSTGALHQASGKGVVPLVVADGIVVAKTDSSSKLTCDSFGSTPLIIGTTHDEFSSLVSSRMYNMDFEALWPIFNGDPRDKSINRELGLIKGTLRNILIWYFDKKYKKALTSCINKYADKLPAVYQYEFTWENYANPWKEDLGAFHGLDIPFLFGNFEATGSPFMSFAWSDETKSEREKLHAKIAAELKDFLHTKYFDAEVTLGESWKPRPLNYIERWGE